MVKISKGEYIVPIYICRGIIELGTQNVQKTFGNKRGNRDCLQTSACLETEAIEAVRVAMLLEIFGIFTV